MGLASLDAALSGLRVSQQQINVISTNVANASTPGYTRKLLPQHSQAIAGVTVGVVSDTVIRNVDLNLQRDLWTQISSVSALDVQESYLERIEKFHGAPDQELSIAAEISRLHDAFVTLSDSPEDSFLLAGTADRATGVANKFNDLSALITTLRNDAQSDIGTTVDRINGLLKQVADLNNQIKRNLNIGRTTAVLEDKRDDAVKELTGLIGISFFKRGDGVLVVQTDQGLQLADERATALTFRPLPLSPQTYYPASAAGIFVGDPLTDPAAFDITATGPGGRLGGLIALRDDIFPQQMAQLDELAHKTALRMDAQGLRLFTTPTGTIPGDLPPDPTTVLPTSVEYVGFSAQIQVNSAILADHRLIQTGTVGGTVQPGSNEVIRRVIEFGFGSVEYQEAANTDPTTSVDIRAAGTGGTTLQDWLGLFSENRVAGTRNLASPNFIDIPGLVASANGGLDNPNDQFQITFEEARTGLGPVTVTIDLSDANANFPIGGPVTDALDQITSEINNQIALAGVPAGLAAAASRGANGEIVLESRGNITVDGSFGPAGIGQNGLNFLGLAEGTFITTDPYFDVQVGNNDPVRIAIEPGDTEAELQAKLIAVQGLAVDTAALAGGGDGFLRLRPGNDYNNPDFGGDIRLIGGPFTTDGAALAGPPVVAGRTSIPDGVNIISALFGTFTQISAGPPPVYDQASPVTDTAYRSETQAGSGMFVPFRESLLGPGASVNTGVVGASGLADYAQKMVNQQAQRLILIQDSAADEDSLREILQRQLLDESGVNIDEELGNLILHQTAYAAAARVITAVDELFQELLNAVR